MFCDLLADLAAETVVDIDESDPDEDGAVGEDLHQHGGGIAFGARVAEAEFHRDDGQTALVTGIAQVPFPDRGDPVVEVAAMQHLMPDPLDVGGVDDLTIGGCLELVTLFVEVAFAHLAGAQAQCGGDAAHDLLDRPGSLGGAFGGEAGGGDPVGATELRSDPEMGDAVDRVGVEGGPVHHGGRIGREVASVDVEREVECVDFTALVVVDAIVCLDGMSFSANQRGVGTGHFHDDGGSAGHRRPRPEHGEPGGFEFEGVGDAGQFDGLDLDIGFGNVGGPRHSGAHEGGREGAGFHGESAASVDGRDFDDGVTDEVGLLRGQGKSAAPLFLTAAGTPGDFPPFTDPGGLVKGGHGAGVIECQDARNGVVVDFEKTCGGAAAFFIAADDEGDGLAAVVDLLFGEEWFPGKFPPEGVAEGRDVAGEEDRFDALGGSRRGAIHPHDGGGGVGAFDDEGGENASAGLPRGERFFLAAGAELVAPPPQPLAESLFGRLLGIGGEPERGDVVFGIAHRTDRADQEGITSKKGSSSRANSPVAVRDSGRTLSGWGC